MRQWAVEQMCGVAAIRTAPAAIKTEVLKFLALQALFTVGKEAYSKVWVATSLASLLLLLAACISTTSVTTPLQKQS